MTCFRGGLWILLWLPLIATAGEGRRVELGLRASPSALEAKLSTLLPVGMSEAAARAIVVESLRRTPQMTQRTALRWPADRGELLGDSYFMVELGKYRPRFYNPLISNRVFAFVVFEQDRLSHLRVKVDADGP